MNVSSGGSLERDEVTDGVLCWSLWYFCLLLNCWFVLFVFGVFEWNLTVGLCVGCTGGVLLVNPLKFNRGSGWNEGKLMSVGTCPSSGDSSAVNSVCASDCSGSLLRGV